MNYYKGHHLFLKGAYASAIPYYEKALEIDPSKIKALREIAYS
ncbi:MAG: tetratricopeptide repeat protein [Candidatus Omnitrophica bacterium]|nr:tetratricopeptide repeat protein [Candidatus Omnitrophota bacterium]